MSNFKHISIRSATFPDCYLRLDGTGVTSFTDLGGGTVNCQSFAGPMETLTLVIDPDNDHQFSIRSTHFKDVYLRMDASGFTEPSTNGGGTVNCQYTTSDWEKFKFVPQPDGTKAIASTKFPGMFLRMDGTMTVRAEGYGSVNCQTNIGPWEKFIVAELNQGLTRTELEAAIAKYGPILKLHKDEIYDNCSVEWFLEHASLFDSQTNTTITHPAANQLPQENTGDKRYWFTLEDGGKGGDFSTAKAYVRAYWTQGMTYTDLQFWFFSAYNGPGTAHVNGLLFDTIVHSGDPNLAPLGEHVGDWEYCVVRVDNKGGHMLSVITSQHGDAYKVDGDKINDVFQMVDGTHPVIYSSRNGHALYPKPDKNYTQYHKFEFGLIRIGVEAWLRNDTSEGGKTLDASKKYQVVSADWLEKEEAYTQPAWVKYPYRWGPEGTTTHMTPTAVNEILFAAIGWLSKFAPVGLVGQLSAVILSKVIKDDLNGPGAPSKGGPWNGNY